MSVAVAATAWGVVAFVIFNPRPSVPSPASAGERTDGGDARRQPGARRGWEAGDGGGGAAESWAAYCSRLVCVNL